MKPLDLNLDLDYRGRSKISSSYEKNYLDVGYLLLFHSARPRIQEDSRLDLDLVQ